ncbi:MAG: PP2C family protein-serine/threonine phosphatase [Bacteroidota bacterium]|nr:PP2C family protein-serine/threonine phosphatase [Bacteroidota bacterium]
MSTQINSLTLKNLELDALLDITNAINRQPDEKSLLKIFTFTLIANFKIQSILYYELKDDKWVCTLRHGVDKEYNPHSEELIQVLETNQFFNFNESEFKTITNHFDFSIPLTIDNKIVSCLLLGGARKFTGEPEAIKFIQTMVNILYVAIQNIRLTEKKIEQETLKNELIIAQKLQTNLFPQTLPRRPDLKVNATYIPHQSVGGDYYDFIEMEDGDFMVSVADVSGKGLSAAFIMSNFQAAFRVLAKQSMRLEDIVTELNSLVYNNTKGEKFITFFVARYFRNKNMIHYCNCGHNAPVLMSFDKHIQHLDKGSMILGVLPTLPFIESSKIYNVNKSVLFAYTDGLVETYEKFNTEAGEDIIVNSMRESEDFDILHHQILERMKISEGAMDDITIISCWFSTENIIEE